jgi:hypothetical protein
VLFLTHEPLIRRWSVSNSKRSDHRAIRLRLRRPPKILEGHLTKLIGKRRRLTTRRNTFTLCTRTTTHSGTTKHTAPAKVTFHAQPVVFCSPHLRPEMTVSGIASHLELHCMLTGKLGTRYALESGSVTDHQRWLRARRSVLDLLEGRLNLESVVAVQKI